jgi:mannose-6-phosphate isomerase-like protein (cupin superfamily)
MEPVDIFAHKGGFFRVLQRTSRSQAAVMTIAPGGDAGPEEEHSGDQIIYIVEGEALGRVCKVYSTLNHKIVAVISHMA